MAMPRQGSVASPRGRHGSRGTLAHRLGLTAVLITILAMTLSDYAYGHDDGHSVRWRYASLKFLRNEGPNWNDDAEVSSGLKFGNSMLGPPGPPLFTDGSRWIHLTWIASFGIALALLAALRRPFAGLVLGLSGLLTSGAFLVGFVSWIHVRTVLVEQPGGRLELAWGAYLGAAGFLGATIAAALDLKRRMPPATTTVAVRAGQGGA